MENEINPKTINAIEQIITEWKEKDSDECLELIKEELEKNSNAHMQEARKSIKDNTRTVTITVPVTYGGKLPKAPERAY